ncbi:armadillo-type protein [Radiomyces spectabilis]|uniref:armadillo-type protein n=1 Tax=Radiomyces spectabilis TaxID=64574 RepID=UPI00221F841E|nr:armadillo-type protein [Radiomyces spectabilis]KAI8366016.1 armadillo-type protein [Radiomyces spectabilis]
MAKLQSLLSSEFLASGSSKELFLFIQKVTESKSKAEEHSHVSAELQTLSHKMGHPDVPPTRMKDYLIRLIHAFMLGYNVDFGVIYAIMTTQSGETALQRRVGYLSCALFLEKNNELAIMLINTLQRDLKSTSYLDVCAALTMICYVEHPEMQDALLEPVIRTMGFEKEVVRKKAVVALFSLSRQSPRLMNRIEPHLREALSDKDPSVVFAALNVWKSILTTTSAERYKDLFPTVLQIFQQLLDGRFPRSYIYHGVLAPWAQIACLRMMANFQVSNIGSPQDIYKVTVQCLELMAHKVDAAYAIILECVQLLSEIDPLVLHSLVSRESHPLDILNQFLHAGNHNLKYLGLKTLGSIDVSLWPDEWTDGAVIGNMLEIAMNDDTIVTMALQNLDRIMSGSVLKQIGDHIKNAIRNSHETPDTQAHVARWFINHCTREKLSDAWCMEMVLFILAQTRRSLETNYVQAQCQYLKNLLDDEIHETELRDMATEMCFNILKQCQSPYLSAPLIQFCFWMLSEYAYLSKTISETDIMKQLQKWITLLDDDYLQIHGLQALEHFMKRSQTVIPGLESILQNFRISPIAEKQQIAVHLLNMIDDRAFRLAVQGTDSVTIPTTNVLSANANRPHHGRFLTESAPSPRRHLHDITRAQSFIGSGDKETSNPLSTHRHEPIRDRSLKETAESKNGKRHSPLSTHTSPQQRREIWTQDASESMLSSLIAFDLGEDQPQPSFHNLNTDTFGKLWLEYGSEKHKTMDWGTRSIHALADAVKQAWSLHIVQIIGQEFIAVDTLDGSSRPVLIHMALDHDTIIQMTVRAPSPKGLGRFMQSISC